MQIYAERFVSNLAFLTRYICIYHVKLVIL